MHELSVATALAESLRDYMRQHRCRVTCAHVRVGRLSGIDPEALRFAWEPALANFADAGLQGCVLALKLAPLRHVCKNCGAEVDLDDWELRCPECRQETLRRTGGNEFILESIEVENV